MNPSDMQNIFASLTAHLQSRGLKKNPKPVWAGYTARPFPAAVLPNGRAVVLQNSVRLFQGVAVWYRVVEEPEPLLAYAAEFLP
jgi:hypothetical protein